MAYYILSKGFRLRGWKGLPFALQYPDQRSTDFFDKDGYPSVGEEMCQSFVSEAAE